MTRAANPRADRRNGSGGLVGIRAKTFIPSRERTVALGPRRCILHYVNTEEARDSASSLADAE
jgi:hypothetical protein